MAYKNNSVYWVGQDGNVWLKKGNKVSNVGKARHTFKNGYDSANQSGEATRIADPNPRPAQRRASAPVGGGGYVSRGGYAPAPEKPKVNQAAVDATQNAINSLDTELNTGYKNIDDDYNSLVGKYNKERGRTKGDYDEQKVTNNTNLSKNKQNSLLAAAQGRRGLRGTLSAIGALSGDGGALADRAVTTSANQDIGGAADTHVTNARSLDKAWDRFDDEDKDRRKQAKATRTNQRTALEGKVESKRQNFFEKMASLYGSAGDTAQADSFLNRAGGLNNLIAQKTRVNAAGFNPSKAAFTPGDLENYLAGAGDMTVKVADGGAGGKTDATSILAGRRNRKEDRDKEKTLV